MKTTNCFSRPLCGFLAVMATLGSASAQFTLSPPTFPTNGVIQVNTSNTLPNAIITLYQSSVLGGGASWTPVTTGSVGQTVFDFARPSANASFYRGASSLNLFQADFILGQLWTNQAVATNVIFANIPTNPPNVVFTITNGPLDFDSRTAGYTVGSFLTNSGATILSGLSHANDDLDNSVMLLTGFVFVTNGMIFAIGHDDGFTFQVGFGPTNFLMSFPTPNSGGGFGTNSGLSGPFPFQLFYGECNGPPAILFPNLPLPPFVTPTNGFASFGFVGGPFDITNENFYRINAESHSVVWAFTNNASWLSASPSGGVLAAGTITNGTLGLNANAYSLSVGVYVTNAWFTNLTDNTASILPFSLTAFGQPAPASQTVPAGSGATFSVAVPTGVGAFAYQWQLNGTNLPSGIITTVAGNGTAGYTGDNGQATSAELNAPESAGVDSSGNLFIADSVNNRIRKVSTNGVITTVAGNGTAGYAGDNGQATNAELNLGGAAVDISGNLFIADTFNNRIRKVGTNGIITTVAGNGVGGYSGDGGQATNAELNEPEFVAVDTSDNLFFTDSANNLIRKVDTNGIITTVAGNGTAGYSGDNGQATNAELNPGGVAVDISGNLIIADTGNDRIRKVSASGIITTIAGNGIEGYSGDNGQATNAALNGPLGVGVDAAGNLFIADSFNNRIRKADTSGVITTVAGNGTRGYSGDNGSSTAAELNTPISVAVDSSDNLFIADANNNRIRKVVLSSNNSVTLTLNNVSANNAGNYTMVIANGFGSVTSAPAILTVH